MVERNIPTCSFGFSLNTFLCIDLSKSRVIGNEANNQNNSSSASAAASSALVSKVLSFASLSVFHHLPIHPSLSNSSLSLSVCISPFFYLCVFGFCVFGVFYFRFHWIADASNFIHKNRRPDAMMDKQTSTQQQHSQTAAVRTAADVAVVVVVVVVVGRSGVQVQLRLLLLQAQPTG